MSLNSKFHKHIKLHVFEGLSRENVIKFYVHDKLHVLGVRYGNMSLNSIYTSNYMFVLGAHHWKKSLNAIYTCI